MSMVAARRSRPHGEGAVGGVGRGTSLLDRSRKLVEAVGRRVPISIGVLLIPAGVGIARALATINRPFISYGDVAVLETGLRDTLGGHQLLGPYSHFGWFHPGPAYFYVFAPVYWVFGESARTMFLAAFLVNVACAVAIVFVVRRLAGEWAARWAALLVAALLLVSQTSSLFLYNPWNPNMLALPFLLAMVLAAGAATGSTLCLVLATLAGSFVIQNEIGTAPTVVVVLVVGIVGWGLVAARRRSIALPGKSRRHLAALAGAAALVVAVWVPPLIQQTTQNPGNAGRIAAFFEHPPSAQEAGGGHTNGQVLRGVAEYVTILPLKADAIPCCEPNQFSGSWSPYIGRLIVFGGGLLVGAGTAVIGWRRRHHLAAALGAISVVASVSAVVSATRVVGPLYEHLVWWTAALLVPAWIGAGILAIDWARSRRAGPLSTPSARRISGAVLAVGCAVASLALAWSLLVDPPTGYGDDPARQAASQLVEGRVQALHARDLRVSEPDPTQFGLAASVIVELQKAGVRVHLEPSLSTHYGPQEQVQRSGRPDQALLVISGPADPAPAVSTAGASHLGMVEGMELWLRPLSSS